MRVVRVYVCVCWGVGVEREEMLTHGGGQSFVFLEGSASSWLWKSNGPESMTNDCKTATLLLYVAFSLGHSMVQSLVPSSYLFTSFKI